MQKDPLQEILPTGSAAATDQVLQELGGTVHSSLTSVVPPKTWNHPKPEPIMLEGQLLLDLLAVGLYKRQLPLDLPMPRIRKVSRNSSEDK
jgi:hypothetical protein